MIQRVEDYIVLNAKNVSRTGLNYRQTLTIQKITPTEIFLQTVLQENVTPVLKYMIYKMLIWLLDSEWWMIFKHFEHEKWSIISIITSIEQMKRDVEKLKRSNIYQNHGEVDQNLNQIMNESMDRMISFRRN